MSLVSFQHFEGLTLKSSRIRWHRPCCRCVNVIPDIKILDAVVLGTTYIIHSLNSCHHNWCKLYLHPCNRELAIMDMLLQEPITLIYSNYVTDAWKQAGIIKSSDRNVVIHIGIAHCYSTYNTLSIKVRNLNYWSSNQRLGSLSRPLSNLACPPGLLNGPSSRMLLECGTVRPLWH